jgi:hypothetical protein
LSQTWLASPILCDQVFLQVLHTDTSYQTLSEEYQLALGGMVDSAEDQGSNPSQGCLKHAGCIAGNPILRQAFDKDEKVAEIAVTTLQLDSCHKPVVRLIGDYYLGGQACIQ